MLMAQAGFEPNARVEYFEKLHSKEREILNGRDPMPETMSTHPSVSNLDIVLHVLAHIAL
jgi:predicted Zn-dependent protease